ncbi:MAG: hypothetical protein AAB518_00295 [Patescibacteria group bacterium]
MPRHFFAFVATLIVLGSVIFSRASAPDAIPVKLIKENRDTLGFSLGNRVEQIFEPTEDVLSESEGDVLKPRTFTELKKDFTAPVEVPTKSNAPLTEAEIFRLQHPDYYLDYLRTIENHMISDGFLAAGNYGAFTGEPQILEFWRGKGFDYFRAKGVLGDADRPSFFRGIETVRRLHAEEIRSLQSFYQSNAATEGASALGSVPPWIQVLASTFGEIFGTQAARAQSPLCFAEGVKTATPGINLIAPCCNCTVLGAPIGCINLLCAGRDAIFDQTNFICGCG